MKVRRAHIMAMQNDFRHPRHDCGNASGNDRLVQGFLKDTGPYPHQVVINGLRPLCLKGWQPAEGFAGFLDWIDDM